MPFDVKCFELADHFLAEESAELQKRSPDLAQTIQDAVEQWIGYEKMVQAINQRSTPNDH